MKKRIYSILILFICIKSYATEKDDIIESPLIVCGEYFQDYGVNIGILKNNLFSEDNSINTSGNYNINIGINYYLFPFYYNKFSNNFSIIFNLSLINRDNNYYINFQNERENKHYITPKILFRYDLITAGILKLYTKNGAYFGILTNTENEFLNTYHERYDFGYQIGIGLDLKINNFSYCIEYQYQKGFFDVEKEYKLKNVSSLFNIVIIYHYTKFISYNLN